MRRAGAVFVALGFEVPISNFVRETGSLGGYGLELNIGADYNYVSELTRTYGRFRCAGYQASRVVCAH